MKRCTVCQQEKDETAFRWYTSLKGERRRDAACKSCASEKVEWPAESYRRVQNFSPIEEYIIDKLAAKPTLSVALDDLFRRNPKRWHQLVVASTLVRKEMAST